MKAADILLGVLVTTIWGSNFSVIEVGLKSLDPFLLTALRFTFTAFPLVLFLPRPRDVSIAAIATYGTVFGVGLWWVVNMSMHQGMSPGLASLVLQFSAFFTILLSALILKERVMPIQRYGMLLSLGGLILVIYLTQGTATTLGVALVLLAAVAWSTCNLIVKRTKPQEMMAFIVWSSAFSAPVLFALTYLTEGSVPFRELGTKINAMAAFSIFFQAYVTTAFGYYVWNNLMKKYPASSVAPLSLIVPVSGIITSHVMFDETLTMGMWGAICVIFAGIALFVNAGRIADAATARSNQVQGR